MAYSRGKIMWLLRNPPVAKSPITDTIPSVNKQLQYARLIAELKAAGVFEHDRFVDAVWINMGTERQEVEDLINQACQEWENHQA